VPSTALETAGARLEAEDLVRYRDRAPVVGLAEFMSFGQIFDQDGPTLDKLIAFEGAHIDGHAPLLSGYELNAYAACGIYNCHESTNLAEAEEKLRKGFLVLIRDGSACKDVATLAPLLSLETSPFIAFCTDDRNPLDIAEEGHLDHVIRTAIAAGAPAAAAYRSASWSAGTGFWIG
jgi:adenine deaminase